MKKIGIGLHNFKIEELEGSSSLKDYKIKSFDALKYRDMEHLPCLFILRDVEDSSQLWKEIHETEMDNLSVCFRSGNNQKKRNYISVLFSAFLSLSHTYCPSI